MKCRYKMLKYNPAWFDDNCSRLYVNGRLRKAKNPPLQPLAMLWRVSLHKLPLAVVEKSATLPWPSILLYVHSYR